MSLRILFATHAPADIRTAVYRSVAQQARHLQSEGHHVDVITRADLAKPGWARLDPIVLPLRLIARRLSSYDVIVFHSYLGWAFHLLKRWLDPDGHVTTITWFHGLEPLYYQAMRDEYRRARRRLSYRFHALHRILLPRLLKVSCRRSDGVFCFNQLEADYLIGRRWTTADRVHLVSNGVEQDCFFSRRHSSIARRILFVGQWLPAKGTRYLVDAFTSLAAIGDFELACVGTGAPDQVVRSEFPAIVRPLVTVLPRVDRDQLYEQLKRADMFLFPTLSEGFSCALLEAMAAELPIVATSVGAAIHLLDSSRNGVLVRCADATALVEAVVRLADDAQTRAALGIAARQTAARFTTRASCVEFATRILDCVRRRRSMTTDPAVVRQDAA